MLISLHKNGTMTPDIRLRMSGSSEPAAVLALRHGVSEQTARERKRRDSVQDPSSTPHHQQTTLSGAQEKLLSNCAVFFCHRIPRPDASLVPAGEGDSVEPRWSDAAGFTVWSCYDLEGNRVLTDPGAIADFIRSEPDTARHCALDRAALSELRKKVEKQLIADYLRPLQAPVGVSPVLKCWMELN